MLTFVGAKNFRSFSYQILVIFIRSSELASFPRGHFLAPNELKENFQILNKNAALANLRKKIIFWEVLDLSQSNIDIIKKQGSGFKIQFITGEDEANTVNT